MQSVKNALNEIARQKAEKIKLHYRAIDQKRLVDPEMIVNSHL